MTMNYAEESLKKHAEWKGKIEIVTRVPVATKDDLSLAYTPGVAQPCLEIQKDVDKSYELTRRWNTCLVVTDGTAVLGLGDIGPEAGMPVMEGKCVLFKAFGDVDAFPICVKSKDVDEIVNTIYMISGSCGGINLEDIAAPRCFEIEAKLKEKCDIPIFHDDQHGTAIITLAGLINALKVVGKQKDEIKVVINGAGAAATAIAKLLLSYGVKDVILCDRKGAIYEGRKEGMNPFKEEMAKVTNLGKKAGSLADMLVGADVFIGVSAPGAVTTEMVKTMNKDAIVFACANPTPGRRQGGRRARGLHRPQRLPEPDQQRAGVPGAVPRRLRRPRERHQRRDEDCGLPRAGQPHLRRGTERELHHSRSVRSARPQRRGQRRRAGCPRQRRRPHLISKYSFSGTPALCRRPFCANIRCDSGNPLLTSAAADLRSVLQTFAPRPPSQKARRIRRNRNRRAVLVAQAVGEKSPACRASGHFAK